MCLNNALKEYTYSRWVAHVHQPAFDRRVKVNIISQDKRTNMNPDHCNNETTKTQTVRIPTLNLTPYTMKPNNLDPKLNPHQYIACIELKFTKDCSYKCSSPTFIRRVHVLTQTCCDTI